MISHYEPHIRKPSLQIASENLFRTLPAEVVKVIFEKVSFSLYADYKYKCRLKLVCRWFAQLSRECNYSSPLISTIDKFIIFSGLFIPKKEAIQAPSFFDKEGVFHPQYRELLRLQPVVEFILLTKLPTITLDSRVRCFRFDDSLSQLNGASYIECLKLTGFVFYNIVKFDLPFLRVIELEELNCTSIDLTQCKKLYFGKFENLKDLSTLKLPALTKLVIKHCYKLNVVTLNDMILDKSVYKSSEPLFS